MTRRILFMIALLLVATCAVAQDTAKAQRMTVPISDPSRPVTVHASLFAGSLEFEAHDRNDVLIEVVPTDEPRPPAQKGGMKVIPNRSFGLTAEELDNVVSIKSDFTNHIERVVVKVPRRTSVSASTIQRGEIVVRGLEGEMELKNIGGSITAADVSGSVVADSTSGDVKVSFVSIRGGASMSFVTFGGNVDVTFPKDLKADLRLHAGQGEIYTDFDVDLDTTQAQPKSDRSDKKLSVQFEQDVRARIGGGGPVIDFKTWSGNIFIRRRGN